MGALQRKWDAATERQEHMILLKNSSKRSVTGRCRVELTGSWEVGEGEMLLSGYKVSEEKLKSYFNKLHYSNKLYS